MCSPVPCKTCGKTTWKGCGLHVDSVKAVVPAEQWCDGTHSMAEVAAASAAQESRATRGGFFARLLRR